MTDLYELLVEAYAVLIGDYKIIRKMAAITLIKLILPTNKAREISSDPEFYPIDRSDPKVRKWKKEILSRKKCECCGSTEHLEAHHIIKWADYPKGRADIENGQCLCHDCHTNEHRNDKSYWLMKARSYR